MSQDSPVLVIVISVAAFFGGYAVISKLIDWFRSRTSAGSRDGPDGPLSRAPRMRMGLDPATSSARTVEAPAGGAAAFEGVLAVCSLVAEAPGSFTFSELGLVKQFLEALGQAQNVPPSHARRIATETQARGCDLEAELGAFRDAYGHDAGALEAATLLLIEVASARGQPTGAKADILDRAATVLGTREFVRLRTG